MGSPRGSWKSTNLVMSALPQFLRFRPHFQRHPISITNTDLTVTCRKKPRLRDPPRWLAKLKTQNPTLKTQNSKLKTVTYVPCFRSCERHWLEISTIP